ncbi:MAG: copper chaperone [Desulfuromonadales bacterium]|nr:MAG: copper chaperone [Desulfuromonadales bacterium]
MRHLIIATAIAAVTGASVSSSAADAPLPRETTLTVRGMMCGSCADAVQKALLAVPGVQTVRVELKGERAVIVHDPVRVTPHSLVEVLRRAGYRAEPR